MKKILYALLAVLLSLTVVSCSSQEKKEEQSKDVIGMPNPITKYDSIEKINEKTGVHMIIPSSIPATDIVFSTINDEIAQIDFKLDNHDWTIRGSKTVDHDISGIYDDNNQFTSGEDTTIYINDYYIDRFFSEGFQFTIVLSTGGELYDEEIFSGYAFHLEKALKNASDPNQIAGIYADSVSQRASMEIAKYGDLYDITVRWPDSASKETQWCMSAKLEDGQLTYGGEEILVYEFDENGNENNIDSSATNNVGYFEIKDGKLYWTGAAQDQCKDCIFEKMY